MHRDTPGFLEAIATVGPKAQAEDHRIARAHDPQLLVSLLRDRRADARSVQGALWAALFIAREVPAGLKTALREAVMALEDDPRLIEHDPREGLPADPLSEVARLTLRQWPQP